MQDYQSEFLEFVLANKILRFGKFTLKSGRVSPYFFNAGLFNTGEKLAFLAKSFAAAIVSSKQQFDVLFGPAYKGIPLASSTAIALNNDYGMNKPYSFNRKEAKIHGEGGVIIGAPLSGRVLIIDDVVTAGTAIREAVEILHNNNAKLAGIAVAMDRQERGTGEISAIQELEQTYKISVTNIINLQNIIDYLELSTDSSMQENICSVVEYRQEYGI